jgi:hypothetical protein
MRAALAWNPAERGSSSDAEHRHGFRTSGVTARWKPSKGTDFEVLPSGKTVAAQRRRAVDLHRDAGDEGRRRRQQEDDGAADLGLQPQAPQRHMVLQLGDQHAHGRAVGVHAAGGDPARRHGVDAHAGVRPFEGGGHRQVAHAGARGAAVAHAGHAVAEVGRHVDDRAAVPLHALVEDLAHHQEAAGQVVGHHRVEALLADGHQRRRELPAGVVDQAVHAPWRATTWPRRP